MHVSVESSQGLSNHILWMLLGYPEPRTKPLSNVIAESFKVREIYTLELDGVHSAHGASFLHHGEVVSAAPKHAGTHDTPPHNYVEWVCC
jgi:hypothetical protein